MKRVLLEPAGRMHLFFEQMFQCAPAGYEFVNQAGNWDSLLAPVLNSDLAYFTLQSRVLNRMLPVHLVKACLEAYFKKPPKDTCLTYSIGHLVLRKEPWVVQIEWAHQLTGFSSTHLKRFRRLLERVLGSPYCRRILCWCELAERSLLTHLNADLFAHKVEIVPYGTPPKRHFVRAHNPSRTKLLFMGSGNRPGEFYNRGGNVVLEAFLELNRLYRHLELVIASDVPLEIKRTCQGIPNITIIEDRISKDQRLQEQVFGSCDIFVFPGHVTPLAILEAMSYELPIVATAVYATAELIEDGKTGLLIRPAKHVPYYVGDCLPTGTGDGLDRDFRRAVRRTDPDMVRDLVKKTVILIDNPELRWRMGKAARWEAEYGRFSMELRNSMLGRIFDEATSR